MLLTRRSLLAAASLAATPFPAWARNLSRGAFTHGVASGDPLSERVILWTRFVGAGGRIAWEIADDEGFARVTARGHALARAANDFCVKIDASGLAPGRRYFYRFLSASGPSPTGRTLTAPDAGVDRLTIALFSCANMPFGYFHAYGHAATREEIDLALHVGDYIYEYERGVYPNLADTIAGRTIEPETETVTLAQYYRRYASYHTDADLLELRRLKPLSAVWDDHELANDTWREGAQNHQQAEGAFIDRIAAASKAYFDWMPLRRPEPRGARLHRYLDWGDLARILLLDTRLHGRDRQIDYRSTLMPHLAQGGVEAASAVAAFRRDVLDDPSRTLLGAEQEAWLDSGLAQSKRRDQVWQIIAQQVVMGEQIAPAGLTRLLPSDVSSAARQWFTAGETVSALGLPWNLDSWGGYPAARARLLNACAANAANAIVLGGDSHNCWVNNLLAPDAPSRLAALEFAGGSVSSPGFERSLSNAQPGEREHMLRAANSHLAWCDLTHRGYGALTFTREQCAAEWRAFADVRSATAGMPMATPMIALAGAYGPQPWAAGA
jgi:alkaline phosphatase D